MRFFQDGHSRIYVDDQGSCLEHHERRSPPMFHVLQSNSAAAYLVRCPASLSESEQDRLNASSGGLEASQKPERLPARGNSHPNRIGLPGANVTKGTTR